jgi:hypothetical protein
MARWAAEKVWADVEGGPRTLWLRFTIDGPGYMLTKPESKPQGGVWQRLALIDIEDAMRIAQRGPRGWPALCLLADKIEAVLAPKKAPE